MPQVIDIVRLRRRRNSHRVWRSGGGLIFRVILGSLSLLILVGVLVIALLQSQVTADLPPVMILENQFGVRGREGYEPVRFYDRDGDVVLYEVFNPQAAGARWLYIQEDGPIDIQEDTLRALLAALDPDYFSRSTPTIPEMVRDYFMQWLRGSIPPSSVNVPQMLVEAQLMPLGMNRLPDNTHRARVHLLGQEISRQYTKSQILEWLVNSADFGHDTFGLDAASLVYLGKHASELSLGESALLAPIILQPSINPINAPEESKERQARVLDTMIELDWISAQQASMAKQEALDIQLTGDASRSPLQEILAGWLQDRLGTKALNRSGMTVFTTIDNELQNQAECTLETQLLRLQGGVGNETVPAIDGSTCLAASLLPPLRPGDQGTDHNIEEGTFLIIDPQSGEILALAGRVNVEVQADAVLSPLIFLTAFSQGYSPGSMILDLPVPDGKSDASSAVSDQLVEFHGPVRIRTALANMYTSAAEQMMNIVGVDGILRIGQSLGLNLAIATEIQEAEQDCWQAALIDITAAYGVLAYQGQKVGAKLHNGNVDGNGVDLQPEILFEVEDNNRRLIYRYTAERSAVVSPQLTYLLNDILRDEPARWPLYGTGNPFEVGRPTAAIGGTSADSKVAWTVGYSPAVVVGVWIGNLTDSQPEGLEVANSAASVWHALMRFATRDLQAQDWTIPPGVNSMEVCDPSGLLPTIHCPEVVNEVFIAGTEPITLDNMYQPFRINRETGKLATLFTPLDQVEERVYLVPPPEAMDWAEAVGLEQPPREYDTLTSEVAEVPGVEIRSPKSFDFVRGEVIVSGQASIEGFANYRLQYGEGLNPTRWVQIGDEVNTRVESGRLARWDTSDLDGLYTLQLIVVDEEGQITTSAINITIDNQPPDLVVILPEEGQRIDSSQSDGIVLQVNVEDDYGVASVSFYIDDRLLSTLSNPPFSTRWREGQPGEHRLEVEAVDLAGNHSIRGSVSFSILDR
jgi:membrane carboxypeptidase/penicillin-binding protein